jgi:hypothetical protein
MGSIYMPVNTSIDGVLESCGNYCHLESHVLLYPYPLRLDIIYDEGNSPPSSMLLYL